MLRRKEQLELEEKRKEEERRTKGFYQKGAL
jgi:hypothetical protein